MGGRQSKDESKIQEANHGRSRSLSTLHLVKQLETPIKPAETRYQGYVELIGGTNNKYKKSENKCYWVCLRDKGNQNRHSKDIVLFARRSDSYTLEKAVYYGTLSDCFDVYEYYGKLNPKRDNLHFIINGMLVFKCDSVKSRNEWIDAITLVSHFDDDGKNMTGSMVNNSKYRVQCGKFIPYYGDGHVVNYEYQLVNEYGKSAIPTNDSKVNDNDDNDKKNNDINNNKNIGNESKEQDIKFHDAVEISVHCIPSAKTKEKNVKLDFRLRVDYTDKTTIYDISKILIGIIDKELSPKRVNHDTMIFASYSNVLSSEKLNEFVKTENIKAERPITSYTKDQWSKNDLVIEFETTYKHAAELSGMSPHGIQTDYNIAIGEPSDDDIPENINMECRSGFRCPIYENFKNNVACNEFSYKHLIDENHFEPDYSKKPICEHGSECPVFKRLSRMNKNPTDLDYRDLCHGAIFRHLPGNCDKISTIADQDFQPYITRSSLNEVVPLHSYDHSEMDLLYHLILEIIANGFEENLCLNSYDYKRGHYSLLTIVNEKLRSKHHMIKFGNVLSRDEMLALLLYTECSCNSDLSESQRNGNYKKWKYLDICLYNAIKKLHENESFDNYRGRINLYSGLNKVTFTKSITENSNSHVSDDQKANALNDNHTRIDKSNQLQKNLVYFPTYVSTSYDMQVASHFAQENGMLIQFDETITDFFCCSLGWISKFRHECEILLARSSRHIGNDKDHLSMSKTSNAAMMHVQDVTYVQQRNSTSTRLEIVKADNFDENRQSLSRFESSEMSLWNNLFHYLLLSKDKLLDTIGTQLNIPLGDEFSKGITLLYDIDIFKSYQNNIKKNAYLLTNNDLILMQQSSPILNQFINDMSMVIFISDNKRELNETIGFNGALLTNIEKMKSLATEQFDLFMYCFESIGETFANSDS